MESLGASPDQSELLTSPEPDQNPKNDVIKHVRLLTSEKKDEKYTYKPKKTGKKPAKKDPRQQSPGSNRGKSEENISPQRLKGARYKH